jgi:hypothetical protein
MASLEERLDIAERMIRMPSFRQNKGLGNEVVTATPTWIHRNSGTPYQQLPWLRDFERLRDLIENIYTNEYLAEIISWLQLR